MRTHSLTMAALAAGLILAGCAKKPPKELPPPPAETGAEAEAGTGTGQEPGGGVGSVALPGSRGDFLQAVGQAGDRIFFDTNEFNVDSQDRATLDAQAAWLQRNSSVRVTIEGHADERGTREYNLALGDRRASSARDYLQSRGVAAARMQTISWGKERPAVDGHDESAWAQNRRAVTVVPQ
jgi:peptidoglycan-associated lipoprotein